MLEIRCKMLANQLIKFELSRRLEVAGLSRVTEQAGRN